MSNKSYIILINWFNMAYCYRMNLFEIKRILINLIIEIENLDTYVLNQKNTFYPIYFSYIQNGNICLGKQRMLALVFSKGITGTDFSISTWQPFAWHCNRLLHFPLFSKFARKRLGTHNVQQLKKLLVHVSCWI